jgi:phosphatidylglycerophosphate synthase
MVPDEEDYSFLGYFFLRHVSYLVSYYVFVALGVSANAITLLSILSGIAAAGFALCGLFLVASLLTIVRNLLDYCDGQVARYTDNVTKIGRRLEPINSDLQYLLWVPCIAAGLYLVGDLSFGWVLAAFFGSGTYNITRQLYSDYPRSILGEPVNKLALIVAAQFKTAREYRERSRIGSWMFVIWRNVLTQGGVFELLFLLASIGYAAGAGPVGLRYLVYFYASTYCLFSIASLALLSASALRAQH